MKALHLNVDGWEVTERLESLAANGESGRRCVEQIIAKHHAVLIEWKHVPGFEGVTREDYLMEYVWPDIDDAESAMHLRWRGDTWTIEPHA